MIFCFAFENYPLWSIIPLSLVIFPIEGSSTLYVALYRRNQVTLYVTKKIKYRAKNTSKTVF